MRLTTKTSITALCGALALLGAGSVAASAQGATDSVTAIPSLTGVGTSVKLDAGTAKALTDLGVSIAPNGNAAFDAPSSTITFPITSGYAEIHSDHGFKPGYIAGSISHTGSGFTLTAGATKVEQTDFVVGALNKAFNVTALKAGIPLGTVHLVAKGTATTYNPATDKVTEISRLTGQSTSVKLDPATAKALGALGVAVAPTGTGTYDSATSTVGFPITGGFAAIHSDHNYKPGYIAGTIIHQASGLKFSKGDKSIEVADFVVDPANSMLTASSGGKAGIPLLFLDGTNVKVGSEGGNVVLDGTVAKLTGPGATALNTTFGVTAFTEGLPLGTVHLVASAASN